jgi:two-component system sensor histidine kinase QseC
VAARRPQALQPLPEEGVLPEVQPLVHALNALFGRVDEQLASERRFTADAAHELRTPIAAIRMQAQVAQGATQDDERRAALAATIAGCDRATRLVEQLLQLARLEADAADAQAREGAQGTSDLAAAAVRQVQDVYAQASARGQHIDLDRPDAPVPVPMSGTLAAVLLRNLVDNALRYGPDGGRVAVQVRAATGSEGARLVVEDAGPGLGDEARARLGERFFRDLGSGRSGSGLGWSIVRRLARLHDLTIDVDRSPVLGGLRVTVRWPAAA